MVHGTYPAGQRRTFHGVRRAWSDDIEESKGLDTVTAAGGWSRRETPEALHISKRHVGHLEGARRRRERETDTERSGKGGDGNE
ncbi:MAG TPA: hypothetical protein VF188_00790 [Longimicrobiales bacterium]